MRLVVTGEVGLMGVAFGIQFQHRHGQYAIVEPCTGSKNAAADTDPFCAHFRRCGCFNGFFGAHATASADANLGHDERRIGRPDHPTGNLDLASSEVVISALRAAAHVDGATVIIASHDQPLLRRTCTRIINLDHGRIASTVTVTPPAPNALELREKRA